MWGLLATSHDPMNANNNLANISYYYIRYQGQNNIKMHKTINLESTDISRSVRLVNKPKQKCCLFAKFSLSLVVACDVANNPHIFITRSNQHIHKIDRHFDGTLNHFSSMVFTSNQ